MTNFKHIVILILIQLYVVYTKEKITVKPSQINTQMLRMKKLVNRSDGREQQLAITKTYTTTTAFKENTKLYGKIDPDDPMYKDRPIFEIFVRPKADGIWQRFKDIACETGIRDTAVDVYNGGILSEDNRYFLEKGISTQLFGTGMGGDRLIYAEVVKVLPQLKKTKLRDINFGYKFVFNNNLMVDGMDDTSMREIWKLKADYGPPKKEKIILPSAQTIDLEAISLEDIGVKKEEIDRVDTYSSLVKIFFTSIPSDFDRLYICSDGSALPSEIVEDNMTDKSNGFLSSAGVVALATSNDSIVAKLDVQIVSDGSVVTSPFDAELLGGLASSWILHHYLAHEDMRKGDKCISIEILSDSKSLIRSLRQNVSPQNENPTDSEDMRGNAGYDQDRSQGAVDMESFILHQDYTIDDLLHVESISDILSKTKARKLLGSLIRKMTTKQNTNENVKNSFSIKYKWVPGHPEKRNDDPQR